MKHRTFIRKLLTTPKFFETLAKHLDENFPKGWIYPANKHEDVLCAVEGTMGWYEAFSLTCAEFKLLDVYKHWESLDWDEGDILDAEIGELLCAIVYDENNERIV